MGSLYTPKMTSRQVARLISDMKVNGGMYLKSKYIVDAILASPKGHHIAYQYITKDGLWLLKYSPVAVRPKANREGSGS